MRKTQNQYRTYDNGRYIENYCYYTNTFFYTMINTTITPMRNMYHKMKPLKRPEKFSMRLLCDYNEEKTQKRGR